MSCNVSYQINYRRSDKMPRKPETNMNRRSLTLTLWELREIMDELGIDDIRDTKLTLRKIIEHQQKKREKRPGDKEA